MSWHENGRSGWDVVEAGIDLQPPAMTVHHGTTIHARRQNVEGHLVRMAGYDVPRERKHIDEAEKPGSKASIDADDDNVHGMATVAAFAPS
ncbi:hypothetical protein GCM10028812_30640 [Ancylobacter sonchi]